MIRIKGKGESDAKRAKGEARAKSAKNRREMRSINKVMAEMELE